MALKTSNKTMPKKALISGVSGQDGSYLAEFLLSREYEVHGIIRRASTFNTSRIDHLYQDPHISGVKFFLHYGDLTDTGNIEKLVNQVKPDEIYHLGAQSHVRVSFDMPEYTANTDALGTLRILEAIKNSGLKIKLYNAGSSEMFGSTSPPQNEKAPFHPRSPYATAKVFSFDMTRMYREAYGMFACNGILFNHECVSENTPVILRDKINKVVSVRRIKDIRRPREKGANTQQWLLGGFEIWDGSNFVDLKLLTATRRKKKDENFNCKIINTRHGVIETTNHHTMIYADGIRGKASNVKIGQKLLHKDFPKTQEISSLSKDEAFFIGMMVGDGYISEEGKGQFSNNDENLLSFVKSLWTKLSLGTTTARDYKTEYGKVTQVYLNGNRLYLRSLKEEIYTYDGFKKVPDRILNAPKDIQLSFLEGYNITDGLESNPCTYQFKNFKTDSILLAHGLLFLISQTTGQNFNITFENDKKNYGYYSINLLSPTNNLLKEEKVRELLMIGASQRGICEETGISRTFIRKIQYGGVAQRVHYLSKDKEEVKKILYHVQQPEWVFDLETASGIFMAGVGNIVVSNSPRRGETFVTRKITKSIARIKTGLDKKVYLGNLEAKRDWGFAPEYIEAMHLMLCQEKPDDYVIATGETHSVREFLEVSFRYAGLGDYRNYVEIDQRYFRPAEVELLIGDAAKAKEKLGWQSKVKFNDLCKIMVDSDLKALRLESLEEGDKILKEKFPEKWWKMD